MAMQWKVEAGAGVGPEESDQLRSVEFIGAWLEPTAVSVDPLLLAGLAYMPRVTLSSGLIALLYIKAALNQINI